MTPRTPGARCCRSRVFPTAMPSWSCFATPTIPPAAWRSPPPARFYCPEDEKVYIDLGFYDELKQRFGAPGEFAEAYVLAHEIGHHVQKLLGIEAKMRAAQQRNPQDANQLSVRLELQADCFAGVWGHSTQERNLLDPGDVDSGLKAAAAVGDDRIQRMTRGTVNPETFTHGSSAQRTEWFQRGFQDGNISSCNTFQ